MKRKYRIRIIVLFVLLSLGAVFFVSRLIHSKASLINEKKGAPYNLICLKYGKPDIEYCSTGNGSFTSIYFIEENTSYMLIFNSMDKLENLYLIKDGELKY